MEERPYHNVFSFFRGPSNKQRGADGSDPQLEDNATKALVNVLELSPSGEQLTASFLEQVADVPPPTPAIPARFFLQGGPEQVDAPRRYLLGLSASGLAPVAVDGLVDGASRADAAIHIPGELCIAIEVKVGDGELEHAQLARHAARFGVASTDDWRYARWADVYRWAERERDTASDRVSSFLLGQLLEFLRLTDLTPFLGWQESDFEFFNSPAPERDWRARQRVRLHVQAAWEAIERELGTELAAAIGGVRVQSIKPHENTAAASTPALPDGVNLTLELWATETQVNLVGWNDGQVATLIGWLRSDRGQKWLHANTELEVVVFARFPTAFTATGRPVWRSQGERELARIPATEFQRSRLDELLAALTGHDHPGIHVRRAWPREEALELREAIAHDHAQAVRLLYPLLAEINATPARRHSGTAW